jgi:hypothetical protein
VAPPPPRAYRWADCDPFVVHSNGIDEPLSVECELSQGSLRCPSWYGDADDVAVLLNAYRSVYGNAEAPSGPDDGGKQPSLRKLRRQEAERLQGLEGPALQAALGERTWSHSARHWWTVTAAMSVWAVPLAGFFAFALATVPCDRQAWVVSVP